MYDIITIGTAVRDAFFEGVEFVKVKDRRFRVGEGICFPFGSKIEVPKITFTTGGAATNTAVTFSRQGLKTAIICRVGNDVSGKEIILEMEREAVDKSFMQSDQETPTAYSVIFLSAEGERTILSYKGAGEKLNDKEVSWENAKTKWLFIGSLGGNKKLLEKLFDLAKANKIMVAGNPGSRELKILKQNPRLLDNYHIFIVNQEEASYLTGIPYAKERKVFQKLDQWVNGIAVMTKGSGGVTVSDGKNLYQAGIFKERKIVDRTGAGDAFGSGFVAGLIHRLQDYKIEKLKDFKNQLVISNQPSVISRAICLGAANATSVVEYIGAKKGILTKEEFENNPRWKILKIKIQNLK